MKTRILFPFAVGLLLAACTADRPPLDLPEVPPPAVGAPIGEVTSSALPPPVDWVDPGMPSSDPDLASQSPDLWRSYDPAPLDRSGSWKGATAWRHPPSHPVLPPPSRAPAVQAVPNSDWADRWVLPVDREGFNAAIVDAMSGREGRWHSSDGAFGVALPARTSGGCRMVEVMLGETEGGLPIRSRGTITSCGD